jgi:hypothetical protein
MLKPVGEVIADERINGLNYSGRDDAQANKGYALRYVACLEIIPLRVKDSV